MTDHNRSKDVEKELQQLNNYSLEIGVFGEDDSFIAMLASVHEFGMTIRPKGKFLTIPLKKKFRKKSALEFKDLFFLKTAEGHKFLVRNKGKDEIEFAYMLVEEIVIPERSFMRSTFDENEKEWSEYFYGQLQKIVNGTITARELYEKLGIRIQRDVQRTIKNMSSPENAPSTVASKGSNNPLIDSGRLRQSVTWKVVSI